MLPSHLQGGVVAPLRARIHPLQPLDDGLHVAVNFTLEGSSSSELYSGVDRVSPGENGLGVGALCGDKEPIKNKS